MYMTSHNYGRSLYTLNILLVVYTTTLRSRVPFLKPFSKNVRDVGMAMPKPQQLARGRIQVRYVIKVYASNPIPTSFFTWQHSAGYAMTLNFILEHFETNKRMKGWSDWVYLFRWNRIAKHLGRLRTQALGSLEGFPMYTLYGHSGTIPTVVHRESTGSLITTYVQSASNERQFPKIYLHLS